MTASALDFAPEPLSEFTSGGLLWRRNAGGIEVCLARNGDGYSIPRGPVLEDERVPDAAVRRVHERTGICGEEPLRIGRAEFSTGEIAWSMGNSAKLWALGQRSSTSRDRPENLGMRRRAKGSLAGKDRCWARLRCK